MAELKVAPAPAPEPAPYVATPSSAAVKQQRLTEIKPEVTAALDGMKQGDPIPPIVQEAMQLVRPPVSNGLQLREFTNSTFRINADSNVDLRLLHRNTAFWSSLAGRGLQKFDDIRVVSENESAVADFLVTDVSLNFVDCEMTAFYKINRRVRPQGDQAWLHSGDQLVMKAATSIQPGGYVIKRANGVELTQSGLPFKDAEEARRYYLDHATNRDSKIAQYFPR